MRRRRCRGGGAVEAARKMCQHQALAHSHRHSWCRLTQLAPTHLATWTWNWHIASCKHNGKPRLACTSTQKPRTACPPHTNQLPHPTTQTHERGVQEISPCNLSIEGAWERNSVNDAHKTQGSTRDECSDDSDCSIAVAATDSSRKMRDVVPCMEVDKQVRSKQQETTPQTSAMQVSSSRQPTGAPPTLSPSGVQPSGGPPTLPASRCSHCCPERHTCDECSLGTQNSRANRAQRQCVVLHA